ncbi:MAG: hypothetical protein ACE5E4_04845 [Candidatus Binatia bacterium]
MGHGLVQAMAALALEGLLLASLLGSLVSTVRLAASCHQLQATMARASQVERLVDSAAAVAGAGSPTQAAVLDADSAHVSLMADLDGNGLIDDRSAELTSLELRKIANSRRLSHRIGRQSMTILEGLPVSATVRNYDVFGLPPDAPSDLRLFSLPDGVGNLYYALPRLLR